MSRARVSLRALAFACLALFACGEQRPHDDFPGMRLLADVEEALTDHEAELKPMLEHYGLVFEVAPEDLEAFMTPVRIQGSGADLALGDADGVEAHGGGYLRLLLDHFRPAGQRATLDTPYRFPGSGRELALRRLYEAAQQQVYLPYAKPLEAPPLPRMLIRWQPEQGGPLLVDSDAYKLLLVLVEQEQDPAKPWTNRQGQPLSVDTLMRRVREHYLAARPSPAGPIDHTSLHVVELLVAYGKTQPGFDFAPIRDRLLGVELAQEGLDPEVEATLRAHHAESLGHLLAAPGLAWSAEEKERAKAWLRELEEVHFPDAPDAVEPLSHLGRGLRLVREHRAVLE